MAYVTTIGANPEQVEYRLGQGHGCVTAEASEIQFGYHTDNRERPLTWIGAGLPEVDIVPGSELTEDQFDAARALMRGADPRTGKQLVKPKLAVYEDAKVPLAPLIRAIQAQARQQGVPAVDLFTSSQKLTAAYGRAVRSVTDNGEAATLRADDAGRIADAAGVDVGAVWGEQVYAEAVANLTEIKIITDVDGTSREEIVPRRRTVGNMGYDISFTLPKSHSLLLAFADEETAGQVERIYTEQVGTTFDWLEGQTAYGMRGKHGGGRTAETVPGTGFLGWTMVHRAARPVGDRLIGDPHWHVHTTVANLTKGEDGKWSTVAAGGRDLMRHIPAADHVLKALIRRQLTDEFGVEFARSERSGAWEVAAIPDATLVAFSKRGASIEAMLTDLGFDPDTATRRAEDLAAAQTRHGKTHAVAASDTTLRQMWQDEARAQGVDPDQLAAAALPRAGSTSSAGPDDESSAAQGARTGGPGGRSDADAGSPAAAEPEQDQQPSAADQERERLRVVVEKLLDPETGLTSSQRRFTRIDAIAAVADAMPTGASDVQEIEELTDRALQDAGIVALPVPRPDGPSPASPLLASTKNGARHQLGAGHMANAARYTTADVVAAERVILAAAEGSSEGQGAVRVSAETAELARSVVAATKGFELSPEQSRIVDRLVTSDRAVDAVLGPPGTGKTTLMLAARVAWESEGHVVAGAATAAVAAQNLQTESGIGSQTVAQWVQRIQSPGGQGLAGVDVLVLDEANLTDDRDRALLYRAAARSGTKMVEVGDPLQLRGVGCGSLFGRVHELVDGAELTVNRRQSDEDEKAAIAAWRQGKYAGALTSWSDRGRLVATETSEEAHTAMVATWMTQRSGAPDPHTEMRGLVMLAASNETVERLNDAAQAVRAATGETGPEHVYAVRAGRTLRVREGDHVMIRVNDRQQRMHEGTDVLNGYRGVVERIDDEQHVHVVWQRQTEDGYESVPARLSPDFVAAGGLSLGYAMTTHKAEGLTVRADWDLPNGEHQGGTVLAYGPGMDTAGMHVATSRHVGQMYLFGALEQAENADTAEERGQASTQQQVDQRVIAGMAADARAHANNANDRPVTDDIDGRSARRPAAQPGQDDDDQVRPVAAETTPERPMSEHTWTTDDSQQAGERWHVGWDPDAGTYFARVEALHPADATDPPAARAGLRGGWPEEGTVWAGPDEDTGRPRLILIDEIDPSGLVAVDDLDPDADEEGALIAPDRFGTRYVLVPPGDDRLAGLDDERIAEQLSPETRERGGLTGAVPEDGTIWVGPDEDTGRIHRLQVEEIDADGGLVAVTVLDADPATEEDGALIAPDRFGTRYTLAPDQNPARQDAQLVDVAGQNPGEVTTVEQLQERLVGRVQIPDDIRAQLETDAEQVDQPAPSRLQAAAATAAAGHDRAELLRRYQERRGTSTAEGTSTTEEVDQESGASKDTAKPARPKRNDDARRRAEDARRQAEARRREEETRRQPDRGRGPRL